MTMLAPEHVFSTWTPWDQRDTIDGSQLPGVYLLAKFKGPPPAVDAEDPAIVYVGETCGQTLLKRWYDFNRSAFQEKPGHSGGWTYRELIGVSPRGLHVAAVGVDMPEVKRDAYIRAVERTLIWQFVQRHGAMPKCNRK